MSRRPEWITAEQVVDVYSVSGHVSPDFADYEWVPHWRHNGWWLFDTPDVIRELAREMAIDLAGTSLFYYEVHEQEYDQDEETWASFEPASFPTDVVPPEQRTPAGFDVVTYRVGTNAECSPLSCCDVAAQVETNSHCLLASFEQARQLLDAGAFRDTEPGPFRILAVYSVDWP